MTHIAPSSRLSRPFLSQLLWVAKRHGAGRFRDAQGRLHHAQHPGPPLIFLGRLEGQGSLARLAAICTTLPDPPHAVGSLRPCLPNLGRALPSPVSMASQQVGFDRSEEILAIDTPLGVTIDAHSTTILTIELASERSAQTCKAHWTTRQAHRFDGLGLASDRGKGGVAGSHAAGPEALGGGGVLPGVARPLPRPASLGDPRLARPCPGTRGRSTMAARHKRGHV
jgi:hypothetical protein